MNLCPSLSCDTKLDFKVKHSMLVQMFNLISLSKPVKKEYYAKIHLKMGKQLTLN